MSAGRRSITRQAGGKNVAQSLVWEHGSEFVRTTNSEDHAWRCSHCKRDYLVIGSDSTSNARKHLKRVHGIVCDSVTGPKRARDEDEGEVSGARTSRALFNGQCRHFPILFDT